MMTEEEIKETVRRIKQDCHSMMNGVVSAGMRERGLRYGVNFGVEGVRLIEMARHLPHDTTLALALWREPVRECRLLATMLYPPEKCAPDMAAELVAGLRTPEEAQYLSMHLLQYLPYAGHAIMEWMASEDTMTELCGFLTAGRLISAGVCFYGRERSELADQCETALYSPSPMVARAAYNALIRFAEQNTFQNIEVGRILSRFARSQKK